MIEIKDSQQEPIDISIHSKKVVQSTLDGNTISPIPKVRTTDGHVIEWNREAIISQLIKDTTLGESFSGKPSITKEEATEIAISVENQIRSMRISFLSGALIREMVNRELLERGHIEWRNVKTTGLTAK